MKHTTSFLLGLLICGLLNSCERNLNLLPQDQITSDQYWNAPNDILLYANQFYTSFPANWDYHVSPFWTDINSDDMIPGTYDKRLAGQFTVNSSNDSWDYSSIRSVNLGLENCYKVKGQADQVNAGIGELRFFRAYFYFDMVKKYGDVPWLGNTINIDSKELFNPRTPRNIVIDSVLADLDNAIANLPLKAQAQPNRLNKECALLFQSRVALFEGTWEKYHAGSPFGVSGNDYTRYLQKAVVAASQLMELTTSRLFEPIDRYDYFEELFGNTDLSNNPEILLWKKFDASLGMALHTQNALYQGGDRGLSKSLVESFLCLDGKPISVSTLYKGDDNLSNEIANRDPRMSQTFWIPGAPYIYKNNVVIQEFEKPWIDKTGELRCTSGYQLVKGKTINRELAMDDWETASIIFRYAEALLNFAEAKAELNNFTQQDADKSINQLRKRVQMPDLKVDNITNDPNWMFPELNPLINEIRRERRVELACEGFRFDDLERWAAMNHIIGKRPKGYKFNHSDFPNLVIGTDIFIDEKGFLDPYQKSLPNGYAFNPNRDYLLPVPQLEINLNENLTQNPDWK